MSEWGTRMIAVSALVGTIAGLTTPGGANIPDPDRRFDGGAAMPGALARENGCESPLVPVAETEANTRRVVGQVVALDEQGGQMVLETKTGRVSLAAAADTISQLEVGDVVVVEMIPDADAVQARADCR